MAVPAVQPAVQLLDETTEAFLGSLPLESAIALSPDDEIVYAEAGVSSATYKVEKVRYVAEHTTVGGAFSVYGRIDLLVSVVP